MKLGKKKGINEVSKKEKEKRAKLNRILFGFVMAIVVFVALVTVENAVIKNEIKIPTVVATQEIPERTVIDSEQLTTYFRVVDVPEAYRPADAISSLSEMGSVIMTHSISAQEPICKSAYTSKDDILANIEDPIEISIGLGELDTSVAGKLRAGDIVNISRIVQIPINDEEFETQVDYIVENALVVEAHAGTPEVDRTDTETSSSIITVYVPRDCEQLIYRALTEGTLRVGLVKDADGTEYTVMDEIIAINSDTVMEDEVAETEAEQTDEAEQAAEETTAETAETAETEETTSSSNTGATTPEEAEGSGLLDFEVAQ